ncbi:MAG: hypothetical protein EPO68_17200 [Planctomycetota bacterium]|nr:MAG: hypothetical protein EPO68_17200 [Planctomycetota bacterium]
MEEGAQQAVDFESLLAAGKDLTSADAARLEARLEADVENERVRGLLLAYYTRASRNDALAAEERAYAARSLERLVIWVMQHHVEWSQARFSSWAWAHDTGQRFRWLLAWSKAVKRAPTDLRVLMNAAFFHALNSESALPLLERARELAPNDPEVLRTLAMHLRLGPGANARSLELLEQTVALEQLPERRRSDLVRLAQAAWRAERWERADSAAREALSSTFDAAQPASDTLAHEAWHVAGKCALHRGDAEEAKRCLLASTDVRPGAVLALWPGPRMELAQRLLGRGERDIVLEYLRRLVGRVKVIPSKGHASLTDDIGAWIASLERGATPDFGNYARE